MNVGDRVRLADDDGATGMVVGLTGDGRAVVHWDVPEEEPYSTEPAAGLVATKGLYIPRRVRYDTRNGTEDPRSEGVNDDRSPDDAEAASQGR